MGSQENLTFLAQKAHSHKVFVASQNTPHCDNLVAIPQVHAAKAWQKGPVDKVYILQTAIKAGCPFGVPQEVNSTGTAPKPAF